MLKSSLCNYRDGYILVSKTITVTGLPASKGNNSKRETFKNYATFTDCICEMNNTKVDNAKDNSIVMSMYNLIKYSDNYLKTSGSFWQYHRDEPSVTIGATVDFTGANQDSKSFKCKQKITSVTDSNGCNNGTIRRSK